MPHFTLSVHPNGGPIIDVIVGASAPRQAVLQKAGGTPPTPISARFLIDTGAGLTAVDPTILNALGLAPTGSVQVHTPTTGSAPAQVNQYDVSLAIPSQSLVRTFDAIPVIESNLKIQGLDGLLGRDVLAHCMLVYLGPENAFALSF